MRSAQQADYAAELLRRQGYAERLPEGWVPPVQPRTLLGAAGPGPGVTNHFPGGPDEFRTLVRRRRERDRLRNLVHGNA